MILRRYGHLSYLPDVYNLRVSLSFYERGMQLFFFAQLYRHDHDELIIRHPLTIPPIRSTRLDSTASSTRSAQDNNFT